MTDKVKEILAQRGPVYGPFYDNAGIAQSTKDMWRATPNWKNLTSVQREALDLIALKVSRVLSDGADPDHADNWLDIAGYATLAAKDWKDPQEDHQFSVIGHVPTGGKLAENAEVTIGKNYAVRTELSNDH